MFDFLLAPHGARLLSATALVLSLGACSLQPRQSDDERLAAWLPADVLLLGQLSDLAILVTMRDLSRVPLVSSAVERLRSVGVRVLGTVVNGVGDAAPRRLYSSPVPA